MITAIYDCRSKQEYIYRTNKIREISGASKLLSNVYGILINQTSLKINNTWNVRNRRKSSGENITFLKRVSNPVKTVRRILFMTGRRLRTASRILGMC